MSKADNSEFGISVNVSVLKDMEYRTPRSNDFCSFQKKIPSRISHQAAIFDDYMYIFGGRIKTKTKEESHNFYKVCLSDLENNVWCKMEALTFKNSPIYLDCLASVAFENYLFLFGGSNAKASNGQSLRIDVITGEVEVWGTPFRPREGLCAQLVKSHFAFLFGGYCIKNNKIHKDSSYSYFVGLADLRTGHIKDFKDKKIIFESNMGNSELKLSKKWISDTQKSIKDDGVDETKGFFVSPEHLVHVREGHAMSTYDGEEVWVHGGFLWSDHPDFEDEIVFSLLKIQLIGSTIQDIKVKIHKVNYQGPRVRLANHSSIFVSSELMLLIGGITYIDSNKSLYRCPSPSIYCYSTRRNIMARLLIDINIARQYHSTVLYKKENRLIIFGGMGEQDIFLSNIVTIDYNLNEKCAVPYDNFEITKKRILLGINKKTHHSFSRDLLNQLWKRDTPDFLRIGFSNFESSFIGKFKTIDQLDEEDKLYFFQQLKEKSNEISDIWNALLCITKILGKLSRQVNVLLETKMIIFEFFDSDKFGDVWISCFDRFLILLFGISSSVEIYCDDCVINFSPGGLQIKKHSSKNVKNCNQVSIALQINQNIAEDHFITLLDLLQHVYLIVTEETPEIFLNSHPISCRYFGTDHPETTLQDRNSLFIEPLSKPGIAYIYHKNELVKRIELKVNALIGFVFTEQPMDHYGQNLKEPFFSTFIDVIQDYNLRLN